MPESFSFRLSQSFLDTYKDREPDWGWKDAAGNSIGELTFVRTYSRLKDDGTKETWAECCERVINGMYSLQKDHCLANRLEWNGHKAQVSAQEAFERMFTFKWTPPGRGLAQMGTPLVMKHKNAASLLNCFTADTKFLTSEGIRTLGETVDTKVEVWAEGEWRSAEVKAFGKQRVQRITFAPFSRRTNVRVVETATPDHRWELQDGTLTTELKVGDVVPASVPNDHVFSLDGFRHGLMFADGSKITHTYSSGEMGFSIRLCGQKAKYLDNFEHYTYPPSCGGDPVATMRSRINLKSLPETDDPNYLRSFIDGWLALDGREAAKNRQISTQHDGAAEWLQRNAPLAGYVVVGTSVESREETNFGARRGVLRHITLEPSPDFWTVKGIESLDEEVEVFCAVVPDVERFTLASGIYTSNCAFVSTGDMERHDPGYPFAWATEALMLGIGVGFDTLGAGKFDIHDPKSQGEAETYQIPDTREGWAISIGKLINSYLKPNKPELVFDYSLVRPYGAVIKTFGGTASGPEPLADGHEKIRKLLEESKGGSLTPKLITDFMNIIGSFVVAGNARRSAELALGLPDDEGFVDLKNHEVYPERSPWAHLSNNSISATVGMDYSPFVKNTSTNGEPGYVWLDTARNYGRMIDPPDYKDSRVKGFNPCVEQPLESYEMCCLVEVHLNRAESLEDFQRTLKFAYLYGKTVTLLTSPWEKTNAVMLRNRRIGLSTTGVAGFVENHSLAEYRTWADKGYKRISDLDVEYSEWLGIRESIRKTTLKPSGSVSLLSGATPGVHWAPGGEHFLRAIRFGDRDPIWPLLRDAGYTVEDDVYSPNTKVVYFPLKSDAGRAESEVSIYEKIHLASEAQRYWSDNGVSCTVSFSEKTEKDDVAKVLRMYEGSLKAISFLPMSEGEVYAQMPYQKLSEEDYEKRITGLSRVDVRELYGHGEEAASEEYCTTDVCEIPGR